MQILTWVTVFGRDAAFNVVHAIFAAILIESPILSTVIGVANDNPKPTPLPKNAKLSDTPTQSCTNPNP